MPIAGIREGHKDDGAADHPKLAIAAAPVGLFFSSAHSFLAASSWRRLLNLQPRQNLLVPEAFRFKLLTVFARSRKCLVVVVLVLSTGLHWAALQSIAWTTMIAANLRLRIVIHGGIRDFRWQASLSLCKAIAAAKKSEKKNDGLTLKLKIEYPPLTGKFGARCPKDLQDLSSG